MTARGYSVLVTDRITELCEYFARLSTERTRLNEALDKAQQIDVTLCSTQSANALKDAISDARDALSAPASENSLMQARYALELAVSGLTNRTQESDGKTVTAGRVAAAVLVVLALVALEVVIVRVRKKKQEKRRRERRRAHEQKDEQD